MILMTWHKYRSACGVFILAMVVLSLCGSMLATPPTLRQVAAIEIPGAPGFDSIIWAGNQLLLAHKGASTVDVFDPAKRRIVAHIDGISSPRGIELDPAAKRIFIADAGQSQIAVVNNDWKVQSTIPVDAPPVALLYVARTQMLYYTAASQPSLGVVDVAAHRQIATIPLDGRASQMTLDGQRGLIYVSVEDRNEIAVVNGEGKVIQKYAVNASQPTGLVVDAANRRLYVAVRYAVLALDQDSGAETGRVPAPAGVDAVLYSPQDHTLFAVATDGTVDAISVSGGEIRADAEFKADVKGHSLAFDTGKKLLYVPGGKEGQSRMVILRQFDVNGVPSSGNKTVAVK